MDRPGIGRCGARRLSRAALAERRVVVKNRANWPDNSTLDADHEFVDRVSSMSLIACAHASIPGACGLTHQPTTPAASLATPHEPLGSLGRITIDCTPEMDRLSI